MSDPNEKPIRSQDEILARFKESQQENSFLNFELEVYVEYMDFERAKPFLTEEVKAKPDEWVSATPSFNRITGDMRNYMTFAWGKVKDHRGISATRSVQKMRAWVWLLGDEKLLEGFDAKPYENYGAPKLLYLCEQLGFELQTPDDPELLRMAEGLDCVEGCDMGCGR